MFKTKDLNLLLTVSLILCISAAGQQPLTQQQIRQADKIRKKLSHYDNGTMLEVRLGSGVHQIGMLGESGSTAFVLVDPVSSKSETVDYLDVKRLQPTRKEYISQQLGKAAIGIPKVAGIALLIVIVVFILAVTGKT